MTGALLAAFGAAGLSDPSWANPLPSIAMGLGGTLAQVGIIAAGVRWGTADVGLLLGDPHPRTTARHFAPMIRAPPDRGRGAPGPQPACRLTRRNPVVGEGIA